MLLMDIEYEVWESVDLKLKKQIDNFLAQNFIEEDENLQDWIKFKKEQYFTPPEGAVVARYKTNIIGVLYLYT